MANNKKLNYGVIAAAVIVASATGCAQFNITGSNTSTENMKNEFSKETSEEIISEMEDIGIEGETIIMSAEKIHTSGEITDGISRSAWVHGVTDYVQVITNAGNVYDGAIIDGEVEIWDENEKYAKSLLPNVDEYDGNAVIQILATEDYAGDINLMLYNYDTEEEIEVILTENEDYVLGLDLGAGAWGIQDYALSDNFEDDHYVEMGMFEVESGSSEKAVGQFKMFT